MDVKMPDGTVIKNVPEGTTQEDLQAQYNVHKFNTSNGTREERRDAAYKDMVKKRGWGSGAPAVIDEAGGRVTDITGSPEAGFAANIALNAIPSLLTMTKGLPGPSPTTQAHNARIGEQGKILEEGRRLGMVAPPTQAHPGFINRALEGISGKSATQQDSSIKNADAVYAIAQREAGLGANTPLNTANLKTQVGIQAQPYREITAIEPTGALKHPPFKSPTKTLEEIQSLRAQSKAEWLHFNTQHDPVIKKRALELSGKADELETTLEAYARQANRPDLVDKVREARVAMAKNYTVQRSMDGSSFDPAKLSQLESRGKAPLTGDLKTVMDMYREFPKAMNAPQKGGSPGVNQLLPWLTMPAGGTLGTMLGGPSGGVAGTMIGLLAGQAIPPAMRSLILSDMYQALMATPKPVSNPALLQGILGNPALIGEAEDRFKNR
jgi:hypothetical protein